MYFPLILENMATTISNNTTIYNLAHLDLVSTGEVFHECPANKGKIIILIFVPLFHIFILNPLFHITSDICTYFSDHLVECG